MGGVHARCRGGAWRPRLMFGGGLLVGLSVVMGCVGCRCGGGDGESATTAAAFMSSCGQARVEAREARGVACVCIGGAGGGARCTHGPGGRHRGIAGSGAWGLLQQRVCAMQQR